MDYECKRVGCWSSQLYKHINMPVHVYIYKWCYSGTVLNGIWVMTIEPGKCIAGGEEFAALPSSEKTVPEHVETGGENECV